MMKVGVGTAMLSSPVMEGAGNEGWWSKMKKKCRYGLMSRLMRGRGSGKGNANLCRQVIKIVTKRLNSLHTHTHTHTCLSIFVVSGIMYSLAPNPNPYSKPNHNLFLILTIKPSFDPWNSPQSPLDTTSIVGSLASIHTHTHTHPHTYPTDTYTQVK